MMCFDKLTPNAPLPSTFQWNILWPFILLHLVIAGIGIAEALLFSPVAWAPPHSAQGPLDPCRTTLSAV